MIFYVTPAPPRLKYLRTSCALPINMIPLACK